MNKKLIVKTAVTNCSGAIEADTIKMGEYLKNQMSRINYLIVILVLVTVMFSMVACNDWIPNGTYIRQEQGTDYSYSYTFSEKNKYKYVVTYRGITYEKEEGSYKIMLHSKSKNFSRGNIAIDIIGEETKFFNYELEGKYLTLGSGRMSEISTTGRVFTKSDDRILSSDGKGGSAGTIPDGTYVEARFSDDDRLRKEIAGSYSFAKTIEDEDIIITINGKTIFNSNGTCEDSGTMIITVFDEDGDKSTLKYQIEIKGKYEIKNSYIVYDYKMENIGIKLIQSDNRELSKFINDHYLPEMKHELMVDNKEKIIELTDRYLKTESESEGEIMTMTYVRLSKPVSLWKTMPNNIITNTSIAGVEFYGKTVHELKKHLNPALTWDEYNGVYHGETLLVRFGGNCGDVTYDAYIFDGSLETKKGIRVGSTSGDLLKAYPGATAHRVIIDYYRRNIEFTYLEDEKIICYYNLEDNGTAGKYSNVNDYEYSGESKIVNKDVKISYMYIGEDPCGSGD